MGRRSQACLARALRAGLIVAFIATPGSARTAVARGPAAKVISTEQLTFTGVAFTPKTLGAGELTFTGLSFSPKTLSTGELGFSGVAFSPKTLTVGELTFSGAQFSPKTLSTAPLEFNGLGATARRAPD